MPFQPRARLALLTFRSHLDAEKRSAVANGRPGDVGLHVAMVAAALTVLGDRAVCRAEVLERAREVVREHEGVFASQGIFPPEIKVYDEVPTAARSAQERAP